jgi:hypothetical protein
VVTRFKTNQRKKPMWVGVLGRRKERADRLVVNSNLQNLGLAATR